MLTDFLTATDLGSLVAYLDPGMGSMQLQIIVAAFLSASFFLKSSIIHARMVIGRILKKAA